MSAADAQTLEMVRRIERPVPVITANWAVTAALELNEEPVDNVRVYLARHVPLENRMALSRRRQRVEQPTGRRPRVLLADDHRLVLEAVSRILADEFDVVATAADGAEAIDLARRCQPDAIVLDVDMPGLDGFQALRAFEREGLPKIPAVFLSLHDAEEIVDEAFRCGGLGYVLKSRAGRDLAAALDQALAGKRFVPALTTLFRLAPGGVHAMQLHRGPESLIGGLAASFHLALRRGGAVCAIATEAVRRGLEERLRSRGWNVDGPSGAGRYLAIDAGDALKRFMRNGLPDRDQLAEIAAELDQYRRAVAGPTAPLTVFGNMVAALSAAGNADAVIALEREWNVLTDGLPVFTLCGYSTACFHEGVPSLWAGAGTEHAALSHANDV